MAETNKAKENRLRSVAEGRGLRLRKSGHGYQLVDVRTGQPVAGRCDSLQAVEAWLQGK